MIDDINPSIILEILTYLYCSKIQMEKFKVLEIIKAAKILNIPDLYEIAIDYITKYSDYDVFLECFTYLQKYDLLEQVFEKRMRLMLEKEKKVYQFIFNDSFIDYPSSIVTEVLKSNEIEISEYYLLERLIFWVILSYSNLRQLIKEVI